MRRIGIRLSMAAALLSIAHVLAVAAGVDLHGSARAGGRPLANAVVWLDGSSLPAGIPKGKVVLDQHDLMFSPHVLAIRAGTTVDFPNNDRVFHNVFSFRDGKVFDLGLYPIGAVQKVKFDHVGLSRIFCNIHPNMGAYVMAVDTPYFAVSDDAGAFVIASIAAGSYTYHAWRAGAAELTGKWVAADASQAALLIEWP